MKTMSVVGCYIVGLFGGLTGTAITRVLQEASPPTGMEEIRVRSLVIVDDNDRVVGRFESTGDGNLVKLWMKVADEDFHHRSSELTLQVVESEGHRAASIEVKSTDTVAGKESITSIGGAELPGLVLYQSNGESSYSALALRINDPNVGSGIMLEGEAGTEKWPTGDGNR